MTRRVSRALPRLRSRLAVLPLAGLVLLGTTGCGADLHPGLAAAVGSDSFSQSSADRLAREVCESIQAQQRGTPTTYAKATLLSSIVQSWVERAMGHQLADEYAVTSTASYEKQVASVKLQLTSLDPGLRDAVIDTYTATPYFVDILRAIGVKRLEAKGTAAPSDSDALTAGIDVAQQWLQQHPIVTSPRTPQLQLGDNSFTPTRTDTSVAVSTFAKEAAAASPSQTYLDTLPASQVCR